MTSDAYRKVLQMAEQLTVEEQLELTEVLISVARHRVALHYITELRGLGKDIGEGVDVAQSLNKERDSQDK